MATWLNDTFTDTNNALLTAHTAETGGTYVAWLGSTSPVIGTGLGGVVYSNGGQVIYRNTSIAPSADVKIAASFNYQTNAFQGCGVAARLNAAGTGGYIAIYTYSDKKWSIYRMGAAGAATLIASSAATYTYAVNNTPAIEFDVTGSGATVTLTITIGGTVVTTGTDTSPDRVTAAGYGGLYFDDPTPGTGIFINSIAGTEIAASGASATFSAPVAERIFPLSSGTTGTIGFTFTGNYSGTAPNQWRIVTEGSATSVTGYDWQTFGTAPASNAFSQAVAGLPKWNGFYTVQVRNSADPTTLFTSGRIGAGVLVAVDGQSNAYLWFSSTAWAGDATLTPNPLLRVTGKQASNAWQVPQTVTMNAAIACGNALAIALQCPVGLIDGSFDGSGLVMTGNGGRWVPTTNNAYVQSADAITAAGGKVIANLWIQGEGDAGAGITQTPYYDGLTTMIAQRRADLAAPTLPYVIVTLGRNTAGMSDVNRERIKLAQVQKCGDANIYRVDRMDLPLHTDGIHHTATGFTKLGQRCAQAVLASVGAVTQYRGPSIASVAKFSATEFDVMLTQHSGSDFTPTTGATGFLVTDPGASNAAIAVSSTSRLAANKIRLTLASAPVGLPIVAYLYGSAPVVSGVVLDNSTLTLPLEYNSGVASTAVADTTAPSFTGTLTVSGQTSSSGTLSWPAATDAVGVTGYEYSVNDGATYTPVGNVLTTTVTGLVPATTYPARARAFDAAGNRSTHLAAPLVTTGGSGAFTTDEMASSGTLRSNEVCQWTWFAGGSIGSTVGVPVHGGGTLSAGAKLTVTGLPAGPGYIMVSFNDGGRFYQDGVAA